MPHYTRKIFKRKLPNLEKFRQENNLNVWFPEDSKAALLGMSTKYLLMMMIRFPSGFVSVDQDPMKFLLTHLLT